MASPRAITAPARAASCLRARLGGTTLAAPRGRGRTRVGSWRRHPRARGSAGNRWKPQGSWWRKVDYELAGSGGSDVFDAGHRELRVGRSHADDVGQHQPQAGEPVFSSSMGRFMSMGLEHILLGVDHVLFLVLLLLGAQGWRSVVRLATSFTLAHSVTLALAVLGWVEVPAEIVEPLIALSIVYVAVENIARGESRRRTLVVFGFGLLHGLGFAGALSFTDHFSGHLLVSLLSFNIGIELGQLAIVLVVFPLILLARRYSWSTVVHIGAAATVGIIGLIWLVERLLAPSGTA